MIGKKQIYQNLSALESVKIVLAEADKAVHEKTRTIKTSGIPEVLGGVAGGAIGAGISLALLNTAGVAGFSAAGITSGLAALSVRGGMVAGIFVTTAPVAVLSLVGYAVLSERNKRHFLAMSISPLLIEVIVRLSYFAKRRSEGYSLIQSLPFESPLNDHKPKLRTMLFSAHLVSTAANAGKVSIGQNPLLINYSQWVAFFRYAVPQVKWVFFDQTTAQSGFVQRYFADDWTALDDSLDATWRIVSGAPAMLA